MAGAYSGRAKATPTGGISPFSVAFVGAPATAARVGSLEPFPL